MLGRRIIDERVVIPANIGFTGFDLHGYNQACCKAVGVNEFDLTVNPNVRVGCLTPDKIKVRDLTRKAANALSLLQLVGPVNRILVHICHVIFTIRSVAVKIRTRRTCRARYR